MVDEQSKTNEVIAAAHDCIRDALRLPAHAPHRFDFYAQEIERVMTCLDRIYTAACGGIYPGSPDAACVTIAQEADSHRKPKCEGVEA